MQDLNLKFLRAQMDESVTLISSNIHSIIIQWRNVF